MVTGRKPQQEFWILFSSCISKVCMSYLGFFINLLERKRHTSIMTSRRSRTGSVLGCLLGKNPLSKGLDFQKTLSICLQNSSSVRISADALQTMSHFLQNLATNIPTFALIFLRESDLNPSFKLQMKGKDVCASTGHSYTISLHLSPTVKSIPVLFSGGGDALLRTWNCPAEEQQLKPNISLQ